MKKKLALFILIALLMQTFTACSSQSAKTDTVEWNGEYDVIVVGYGGAGASASIAAADKGAKVLMLEKAPKGEEGGNTKYSGQGILSLKEEDVETATTYFKHIRGEYNTPSDNMITTFLEKASGNYDWLKSLGAENIMLLPFQEYDFPGGEVMQAMVIEGQIFSGSLYRTLQDAVKERSDNIDVWYESPGVKLIQDPDTKIVNGVKVDNNGKILNIRAKNGVVLATGGFENNQQMIQDYLQLPYGFAKGARYNTGDGIKMAMEVGANLWHMSNIAGPDLNVLNPETGNTFGYALQGTHPMLSTGFSTQNVIFVGADGTRFVDESVLPNHGHIDFHGSWEHMPLSLPAHAIFDETARLSQPIYSAWSEDSEEEIKKGLIVKADTIEELAKKIGVDPAKLEQQIKEYNKYCADGKDPIFNRNTDTLKPIKSAPYYAMELVPSFTNTQGGPERNENGEVLDVNGKVIPHLYSAGELGSMFSSIYQGTGNLGECVAFGRISGEKAAEVKDDVSAKSVMKGKTPTIATWKDAAEITLSQGQYLGEGTGIGGTVKVKVTMDGDKISEVEVVYHNETEGISDKALSEIPAAIVKAQSPEVDVATGATYTSKAIIEAVIDVLEQAQK